MLEDSPPLMLEVSPVSAKLTAGETSIIQNSMGHSEEGVVTEKTVWKRRKIF